MQEDRPNMNQRVANKLSEQSPSTSTAFPHMGFAKSTGSIAASPMSVADNVTSNDEKNRPKKKPKEQPKDKPKRPLSAYNLFFKHERGEILRATPDRVEGKPRRSHGKIGFADLARNIAANWKSIDAVSRAHFDRLAAKDKERYRTAMEEWKKKQEFKKQTAQGVDLEPIADGEPISMVSQHDLSTCPQGREIMPYPVSDVLVMGMNPMYKGGKPLRMPSPAPMGSLSSQSSLVSFAYRPPPLSDLAPVPMASLSSQSYMPSVYRPPPLSDLARDLDEDCKQYMRALFRQ
jgi:hypothetical protein